MRRCSSILLATLFLAPMQGAAAGNYKPCNENLRRVSHLGAIQVSCRTARWVARRFDRKVIEEGHWPTAEKVGRYRCRSRSTGPETYRVRCTRRSGARVRFDWGV